MEFEPKKIKQKISLPEVIIDEFSAPKYCSREVLNVVNSKKVKIGEVKINTNIAQLWNFFEFIIHFSNELELDTEGVCGLTVTSRVRPNLITVEEKRFEHVKFLQRMLLGELNVVNFVSEGANLMILKSIALNGLTGKLKTKSVLINGTVCKSVLNTSISLQILSWFKAVHINQENQKKVGILSITFQIATREALNLNNHIYVTTKVTRLVQLHINSTTLKLETWLNENGHILRHSWGNTEISMQIDPLMNTENSLHTIPLENSWESDLQLASIYIDKMEKLKSVYKTYLYDYPETGALLSDFLFQVLLVKPSNVINFAINFFTSFSKKKEVFNKIKSNKH
ncbi:ciliogenesis-associated TTC17-interacting protein [Lycorma delicatula]|uniref:ciliogenesis-associated TTC17-interacting protein n=1 Tax=Lycorma delicatula TaxID=130591 RepID=UPI003F50FE68